MGGRKEESAMNRVLVKAAIAAAALVALLVSVPMHAKQPDDDGGSPWISDPVGDFLPGYTGPQDPGLDVIAHRALVTKSRVIFCGKMAGPIAPTGEIGGLYIIGVDRGSGTPRFRGRTPAIGPNVLWDSVVRVNPDGTGLFNNIIAGIVTPLDPSDISINDNEFSVSVPLSAMLPAATRPPEEWTYNLWPRNSAVIGNNAAVPDLAPDDGNSPMRSVPPKGGK